MELDPPIRVFSFRHQAEAGRDPWRAAAPERCRPWPATVRTQDANGCWRSWCCSRKEHTTPRANSTGCWRWSSRELVSEITGRRSFRGFATSPEHNGQGVAASRRSTPRLPTGADHVEVQLERRVADDHEHLLYIRSVSQPQANRLPFSVGHPCTGPEECRAHPLRKHITSQSCAGS